MEFAIVAVTKRGIETAIRINKDFNNKCKIYTLEKYCENSELNSIKTSLKEEMKHIFQKYDRIILIMACGIAVRVIAPYIESKKTDPAVVVLDEGGKNVISLLSGHIGGANELAEKVAKTTGGNAIITTASDNLEYEAVDMLAKRFNLVLENFDEAKTVTSDIVNGKKVGLISELSLEGKIKGGIITTTLQAINKEEFDSLIYIGNRPIENDLHIPIVHLIPKNLVLGIGCRKNIETSRLMEAVNTLFYDNSLCLKAVKLIATIDIKKNEEAIIHLGNTLGIPIIAFSPAELKEVEGNFLASQFVKDTVGVGNVCEPSAYLASKHGRCLVGKIAMNGITLCIYEDIQTGIDSGGDV